ncbi:hypothetical protein BDV28DRAFT_133299 [Aspergillus coremiiformis]|uniref:Uncharacterized protein n=1 Tax=Aspergillus coremiiformis TaxID=138285 RepID=A0A5N6Z6Q5_9EURO|nr:hypothetical protein BDV28DRAFT_133299 [Aspergillus coremiiformis]
MNDWNTVTSFLLSRFSGFSLQVGSLSYVFELYISEVRRWDWRLGLGDPEVELSLSLFTEYCLLPTLSSCCLAGKCGEKD